MREVDETLLILKKFRFPDFYGTLSGLPQELWRKILHLTFLNRPGSEFFSRRFETPLPMILGFWSHYWEEDNVVRYVSRHTFATRLQASIRGLLQRWRDLKQDLKGIGRLQLKGLGSFASPYRTFNYNMQLRFVQTPAQLARTQSNMKRWKRRLRREHGETVAEGVLDSYYLRQINTIFKKINWFDHRKRLGVKLLDFGS